MFSEIVDGAKIASMNLPTGRLPTEDPPVQPMSRAVGEAGGL